MGSHLLVIYVYWYRIAIIPHYLKWQLTALGAFFKKITPIKKDSAIIRIFQVEYEAERVKAILGTSKLY